MVAIAIMIVGNGFVYVSFPVPFDLTNDFFRLQENIIGKF